MCAFLTPGTMGLSVIVTFSDRTHLCFTVYEIRVAVLFCIHELSVASCISKVLGTGVFLFNFNSSYDRGADIKM